MACSVLAQPKYLSRSGIVKNAQDLKVKNRSYIRQEFNSTLRRTSFVRTRYLSGLGPAVFVVTTNAWP